MNEDTKNWLMAGIGVALAGYLWNKYNTPKTAIYTAPSSTNLLSKVGGLITSASTGNTGINGGAKSIPATTNSSPVATSAPAPNNTPVTVDQFVDVIGQFNNIISTVVQDSTSYKEALAKADPNTKFTEALKWLNQIPTPQINWGVSGIGPATMVVLAMNDGYLTFFDKDGKYVSRNPDVPLTRGVLINAGYKIF